jgi:hypothetical protein
MPGLMLPNFKVGNSDGKPGSWWNQVFSSDAQVYGMHGKDDYGAQPMEYNEQWGFVTNFPTEEENEADEGVLEAESEEKDDEEGDLPCGGKHDGKDGDLPMTLTSPFSQMGFNDAPDFMSSFQDPDGCLSAILKTPGAADFLTDDCRSAAQASADLHRSIQQEVADETQHIIQGYLGVSLVIILLVGVLSFFGIKKGWKYMKVKGKDEALRNEVLTAVYGDAEMKGMVELKLGHGIGDFPQDQTQGEKKSTCHKVCKYTAIFLVVCFLMSSTFGLCILILGGIYYYVKVRQMRRKEAAMVVAGYPAQVAEEVKEKEEIVIAGIPEAAV